MTTTRGAASVLQNWGEGEPGPMNGRVGQGLAEVLVRTVQGCEDVTSICDLGCGNGYLASRLGALGYQVTRVDASDRLLAVAAEHYATDHVTFQHAVFGEPSAEVVLPAAHFDLVISSDVVEHLFVPDSLVQAAHRILKPGGRLVLGTPYHGYAKNLAISLLGEWDRHHTVDWDGGHIKFFSVATLTRLVERAGFTVDRFVYYGRARWFWKNMICVARKPE